MKCISVVMKKELDRVFHDRKLIFSLFILPAVVIVAMYSVMGMMMNKMEEEIMEHTPVIEAIYAPEDFAALLDSYGMPLAENESDLTNADTLKELVRDGVIDVLLVFPEDFSERVASYQPGDAVPEIRTFYNPAETYSSAVRDTLGSFIFPEYESMLLRARFTDLDALTPFVVDSADGESEESSVITNEGQETGQFLGMLFPYLIVMLLFTGPMSLGVDAIAGEKERGTLASMLITPAPRRDIVLGKLFSLEILSFLSAIVYAVAMLFAIPSLAGGGLEESASAVSLITPLSVLELFAVMIALVFFYVSVIGVFSIRAKSIKEASSYISMIYILVILAGVLTMFSGFSEPPLWRYAVPVYGSALSLQGIITGDLPIAGFLLSIGCTVLFGFLLTWLITRAINDERVVFNA